MHKVTEDEQQKLSQEYQDYQRKLEQKKEEYRKDHPELQETDTENWFETDSQRELRQIFQGQSSMFDVLRDLNRKIDEVVGRQERTLSLLSTIQQGAGIQMPPGVREHPPALTDGMKRHEIDALLQNQNVLLNTAVELKYAFVERR